MTPEDACDAFEMLSRTSSESIPLGEKGDRGEK